MPKIKTLFALLLVITFSFSLLGCGLIASRTASTDEVVEMGGQVPEWLLLSHRSLASEESDIDDLAAIDEEDEEDETDEAVGGVDEDDGVAAGSASGDSSQTEQASSEVAQAAETGSSGSTQQQASSSSSDSGSSSKSERQQLLDSMKPGTRAYLLYLQNREPGESEAQFVDRLLKKQEEDKKAEESAGDWFHDMDSPSGWAD